MEVMVIPSRFRSQLRKPSTQILPSVSSKMALPEGSCLLTLHFPAAVGNREWAGLPCRASSLPGHALGDRARPNLTMAHTTLLM